MLLVAILLIITLVFGKLRDGDCEVCLKVMKEFQDEIKVKKAKDINAIRNVLKDQCQSYRKGTKERRLCYYIGADETSASGFLKDLSKWFSFALPPEKVSFFFTFFVLHVFLSITNNMLLPHV